MEEHKWRYLQTFLQWTEMRLEDLVIFVWECEARAREYYAEKILFTSDEFVEIMLVDATFTIVLLLKFYFSDYDNLLGGQWVCNELDHDLELLENQIPLFILKDLFNIPRPNFFHAPLPDEPGPASIMDLVRKKFHDYIINKGIPEDIENFEPRHFVDVLRICHIPRKPRLAPNGNGSSQFPPSLTDLHVAGVTLLRSESKNYADLEFTDGVLKIPHLVIDDGTSPLLRNLVAFEQCRSQAERYVTDYIFVMDSLINTPKDVELLCQKNIFENILGDNLQVSNLFNDLGKETTCGGDTFYYAKLCEDLNQYFQVPWHKWKATFKHDYLKNPWTIISVIAGSILLLLTLTQTIASIISVT